LSRLLVRGDSLAPNEVVRYRKDGSPVDVIASGSPIRVDGELIGAVAIYTDISERKRAERLLRGLNDAALAAEQVLTLDDILDAVGQEFTKLGFHYAVLVLDEEGQDLQPAYFSYEGRAVRLGEKLLGIRADQVRLPVDEMAVLRRVIRARETLLVEGEGVVRGALPPAMQRFAPQVIKILRVSKSISAPLIVEDEVIGLLAVQSDDLAAEDIPAITAFAHQVAAAWRRAQLMEDLEESLEELKRTQAQFLQAQKMEAVGRLAGGVAHDFNNALTIIRLSLQLIRRHLRPEDPLWEYVEQIEVASDRATGLTKQLLSFSRREIVEPQILGLNEIVENMSQMLQRIIGEDIELVISLGEGLWPVYLDATQLDQVIVNLVVNARDAMAYGGVLAIETENVVLDEAYAAGQVDVEPGEYVLLMVSDTGKGMNEEVQSHLFEPFFTTKERGKGTGLGLATVYGIVKGCGGHIGVYSEQGQGTTFRVYLPRTKKVESESTDGVTVARSPEGSETVLLVEDDASVREMATKILETYGYQIIAADSGPVAIDLIHGHKGPIHLLLTDVVLPQMSGRKLAEALRTLRPEMRVLYMSGYSESTIAHHGLGGESRQLLPKPFTVEALVQKVRNALDGCG
jgi:signal transduction histidine kinase/ActR/RegA family two-component response regulator